MEEAVEICKLRLFLKLVAQIERVEADLEPLPDIDFNIRSGNTLVGFVSVDEIDALQRTTRQGKANWYLANRKPLTHRRGGGDRRMGLPEVPRDADLAGHGCPRLRLELSRSCVLDSRNSRMNWTNIWQVNMAIDLSKAKAYGQWCKSHQPFHWFAESNGIMSRERI